MAKENLTLRIDSEPNETTYNAMESAKNDEDVYGSFYIEGSIMEFEEKKKSKNKLFIVSIILLAVGLFAYFDREKFSVALFIIGCIAYSGGGISYVKKKLDENYKERYESTKAAAVLICLIIHLIGVAAFIWVLEENEKNKVEDTKPYYNILAPSHGTGTINRKEMEEYLDEELYYSELRSAYITDKKNEWIDDVNKCLDDIIGDRKNP